MQQNADFKDNFETNVYYFRLNGVLTTLKKVFLIEDIVVSAKVRSILDWNADIGSSHYDLKTDLYPLV